ncbi:MAG: LPS-assembly protein LptD [Bacteroidia bacterium]|nr:LPS-assembly protein LptD [Bacteroidia bacterium]
MPFFSVSQTVTPVTADTTYKVTVDTLAEEDEPLDKKVIYNARDSIRYEAKNNKVYLFGDAYVEYGEMNLKSEFIEIDYSKNLITAFGTVDSLGKKVGTPIFHDNEQEFNAEKIMYNLKTKKGKIFNVLTKQGDLLVFGNEIKKDSTDVIYMKNLKCIPCQYEDAKTVFIASKAKIIPDDKIVTGPMYLQISEVPTPLMLPFGYFPNSKKRHNGILLPFVGNSPGQGYFFKDGGFYWGINDKTDMIIRGDIYSNKSWGLRTTNNYNVLYKYNGAINLGYSEFIIGDKDVPAQYSKQKSYNVNWQHIQDNKNNPSVRFSANVNYINQKYNKFNAQNSGQYLANTFQSNVNFTKSTRWSSLSINAMGSQNTITGIVDLSFPQLTFNVNRFFPFKRANAVKPNVLDKIGVNYLLEARNTLSGYDSILFKGDIEKRLRYGIRHSLPISTNFNIAKYITVTPAVNLSSVMYTKTTKKEFLAASNMVKTDTVNGFAAGYDANFTTAVSTKLFMDYFFKSKRLTQIRHLLIPTVTYLYRPDFGEEQYGFWKKVTVDTLGTKQYYTIFQNNMFGGPQQGEQNTLNFNLNNNIEAKVRQKTDTGVTYVKKTILQNLSVSGFYNFAADSFNLSNINVSARNKIFKFFDLVGNAVFDPYVYDTLYKRDVARYQYNETGQLARFTSANVAINASFSSNLIQAAKNARKPPNMTNGAERGAEKTIADDGPMQWSLNVFYNMNITQAYIGAKPKYVQSLNFSGDINVTKYWKIGATSGYDFTNKQLSYTSVNLYRDLKCWEARIDWVPFGFRKSYSLTINLKTSMLSDIKIPRQRQWFDNY